MVPKVPRGSDTAIEVGDAEFLVRAVGAIVIEPPAK